MVANSMVAVLRVGVDIGGTFTDVLAFDESTGEIHALKIPTTPKAFHTAAVDGLKKILQTKQVAPEKIEYIAHGTTVGTNAVLERRGAKTALIVTKGFKDILEIRRLTRPSEMLYNPFEDLPAPLIPRYLVKELDERINYRGEILKPLDEKEVYATVQELVQAGVESIAVCLLFSFVNPVHEQAVGRIIKDSFPGVSVSLSSEILSEIREYERASTTSVNAYIAPVIQTYLETMIREIRSMGLKEERLYIAQSNGGLTSTRTIVKKPVAVLESGPAAGAIATKFLGDALGLKNLIAFDMGGTTTKACLIIDGAPRITLGFSVGGKTSTGRASRGSGFPVALPMVDLAEIGKGGGSIAWVDEDGGLRVGPQSAGAFPGPACYGHGGDEPTVTDADLILGMLNRDKPLGGKIRLRHDLAERALTEKIGRQLGFDAEEAASAVYRITSSHMSDAVRLITVESGYDPRDFTIVCFGGAGPLHSWAIMKELRIKRMIIPEFPGLFCSFGLLAENIVHDYVRTYVIETSKADPEALDEIFSELEQKGMEDLEADGVPVKDRHFLRTLDMRYVGQLYYVNVPVKERELSGTVLRFHRMHHQLFGHSFPKNPTEIVNLRVKATGFLRPISFRKKKKGTRNPRNAFKGRRVVHIPGEDTVKCDVYERSKLLAGNVVEGPAVVEQEDSTTFIPSSMVAEVDSLGNLQVIEGGG